MGSRNFGRFYALLREMPWQGGDREELKRSLVRQFTDGRTESVREMDGSEFSACCAELEKLTGRVAQLKKGRSALLKQMQRMGVNTAYWASVDNFCMHPRIAGKRFCRITLEEMPDLRRKLHAIEEKRKAQGAAPSPNASRGAGGLKYFIMDNEG